MSLDVAFAGTPEFAATVLRGLLDSRHEVGLVISQPDSRRGRGRRLTPTPTASLARESGVPLSQPAHASEAASLIAEHDVLVVAAYGQILRPDTLFAARLDSYNVHASLLPKYRGAAPVERAIMDGESGSGITIMKMDEGLDTGDMALQREVPIPPEMTGGELTESLAIVGAESVVEVLGLLEADNVNLIQQDSLKATYAAKVEGKDQVLEWGRGVVEVRDRVRALSPHIGARAYHEDFEGPLKVWISRVSSDQASGLRPGEISVQKRGLFVGCGDGVLELLELQAPGGRRLRAEEFLLGRELSGSFTHVGK